LERPVNDLFNTQRESKGVKVIPMNKAVFECMRALKNNELIAILGDRDFSETGEVMDFLGKKALIPKGAATFSVKTGAGIIPMFLLREDQGSFVLEVENPIFPNETLGQENDKKAVSDLMKKYVPIIERKIKKNPTQWLMFRKFWIN